MCVQSCMTLWNPMGGSPPCLSTHGIFRQKILEEVAISYFKDFSDSGIEPTSPVSPALAGRFFTQIFYCVKPYRDLRCLSGKEKGISFQLQTKKSKNKSEVLDKRKNKVEISEMEVSRIGEMKFAPNLFQKISKNLQTTNHTDRWGDINYQQQKGERGRHHYRF